MFCFRRSRRTMNLAVAAALPALLTILFSGPAALAETGDFGLDRHPAAKVESAGGFVPPSFPTAHITANVAANLRPDKTLPPAYDARHDGLVSSVKNQGACGACYAFGTAADLESRLLADGRGEVDLSENYLKECHYQQSSCLGGNQNMTISLLTRQGAVLENCDPYVASNTVCASGCVQPYLVTRWIRISGDAVPDPAVLKQYLLDHGPLHTSVFAGDASEPAFQAAFNAYDGTGALYFTGANTPNHSVFLVGWDDDVVHTGGTGAWIVKNSWGTGWGGTCGYGSERGYFYIAYGSAGIGKYSSVIVEYMDADDSFSVLSHDEGGFTGGFGAGSPTFWGLSSLTAAEDTYLHRVEFFTTDVTTDVDVRIYGGFNGTSVSGLLAASDNHAFAEPGYHYVQLAEPLPLDAGQTVHVVVKFGNQSYQYPLAVDGDGPVDSGKSYCSLNGSSWINLAGYNVDTTVRARVSTSQALGVEDPGQTPPPADLPGDLRLEAAYPNPFNPSTTIVFALPRPGEVELGIFDLKGASVRTLVTGHLEVGEHRVVWDGRDDEGGLVPSGIYFCRAAAGRQADALKLILLK